VYNTQEIIDAYGIVLEDLKGTLGKTRMWIERHYRSLERKQNGSFGLDPSASGYEPVEGSCKHNSKPPSSIKVEDFS
jgi:hypothetical protein